MSKRVIKIGGASAFLGDSAEATPQLLQVPGIDYLIYDYLAEATMAILARSKSKSPETGGYASHFVQLIHDWGRQIALKKVRLVTNAGGISPAACASALRQVINDLGLKLKVGVVDGDDLLTPTPKVEFSSLRDMYTREPIPENPTSANAYFGAAPIAECLAMEADIVVTGRCVDSALVLGILIHEFDWQLNDFDRMAQGTLCGHLLECGAQASGGTFTDWFLGGDWSNIGYPVAEVEEDGSFVISKPEGTGGLVTFATVAEQMVYEIDDPANYLVPDAICDFTGVKLTDQGGDRVLVRGARGSAPTDYYKVSATYRDGYRCIAVHPVVGMDAARKADKQALALIDRTQRRLVEKGLGPFTSTYVELLGAESAFGANARNTTSREIVSKIVVDHPRRDALELFATEAMSPITSMAPGSTSWHDGRPGVHAVMRVWSCLVAKEAFPARVEVEGDYRIVAPVTFHGAIRQAGSYTPGQSMEFGATASKRVRLVDLAWARSGDKGDRFMVGIIARKEAYMPYIKAALSKARVIAFMQHVFDDPRHTQVDFYDLSGICALHLVFQDAQHGGTLSSPRLDPLSKGMAQQLLEMEVSVAADLEVDSYESRLARCTKAALL